MTRASIERRMIPMQDEIKPIIHDGQPGRDDFAKPPKDLRYPSNSLYYSGPSKMIETHVTKKDNMKDENWVDSISLSRSPQKINYRELDDESLNRMIKDVRNEYERRQRERFDMALKRRSDLELRKELQGE